MSDARKIFWQGVRAQLPLMLGLFPFGMIYGVLAIKGGMPAWMAQLTSVVMIAGSAQLMLARLLGEGTGLIVVAATLIILNVRHLLYSASMSHYVRHLSLHWRALLAYLLTDEAYAVSVTHYRKLEAQQGVQEVRAPERRQHWHLLGSGLTLWVTWQSSTAVGVFVGAQIPASWSLDFTIPLTFTALLIPSLNDRASVFAAIVAGLASIILVGVPLKLGLVIAILIGIAAGVAIDMLSARLPARPNSLAAAAERSVETASLTEPSPFDVAEES